MHFFWLQDRIAQWELLVYWQPGSTNHVDYQTKHHYPDNHRAIKLIFLYIDKKKLTSFVITRLLRGCHNNTPNPSTKIYLQETSTTQVQLVVNHVVCRTQHVHPKTFRIAHNADTKIVRILLDRLAKYWHAIIAHLWMRIMKYVR